LNNFSIDHKEIALVFIKEGWSDIVIKYIEHFIGLNQDIYQELINKGSRKSVETLKRLLEKNPKLFD
jgi:hypothetical protein